MIVALDVGYTARGEATDGLCGVVAFATWTAALERAHCSVLVADVAPYVPGRLYERELPCLVRGVEVLAEQFGLAPSTLVIDGNVRLDQSGRPGLGQHLFEHYGERVPVVGVAKSAFTGLMATEVRRGRSDRPLFVTAAGMAEADAAAGVASMAGPNRIPTLLGLADALSRGR